MPGPGVFTMARIPKATPEGAPSMGFPAMTNPFGNPPPDQTSMNLPGSMLASAQNLLNLLFPPSRTRMSAMANPARTQKRRSPIQPVASTLASQAGELPGGGGGGMGLNTLGAGSSAAAQRYGARSPPPPPVNRPVMPIGGAVGAGPARAHEQALQVMPRRSANGHKGGLG